VYLKNIIIIRRTWQSECCGGDAAIETTNKVSIPTNPDPLDVLEFVGVEKDRVDTGQALGPFQRHEELRRLEFITILRAEIQHFEKPGKSGCPQGDAEIECTHFTRIKPRFPNDGDRVGAEQTEKNIPENELLTTLRFGRISTESYP
jgi:hypothetical protein